MITRRRVGYSGQAKIWPFQFWRCRAKSIMHHPIGRAVAEQASEIVRVEPYPIRLVNWFMSK
jgi:hypothetical protein